jgi:hypothetical protein
MPPRHSFERAFLAMSRILGSPDGGASSLSGSDAELEGLVRALAEGERGQRAARLAEELRPVLRALESRRLS